MKTKAVLDVLEDRFAFVLIHCVIVMHVLKLCVMIQKLKNWWKWYWKTMARIKTNTHTITTQMCGKCGIILAKSLDIFDHCPKCKEIIEAWYEILCAERVVRIIQENMFF